MRIVFVTGPAYSGKTIYIGQRFPGAKVITERTYYLNIYGAETNEMMNDIHQNAQYYCREGLQNLIRQAEEDDIIVFEHTLLHKDERKFYIDAVKEVTDVPVECVVMCPNEEDLEKMFTGMSQLRSLYDYHKDLLELPDLSEGFVSVTQARPLFLPSL